MNWQPQRLEVASHSSSAEVVVRISVCPPLDPCTAVLYILDPEPELFGLSIWPERMMLSQDDAS